MSFAGLPAPVRRLIESRVVFHALRRPMGWGTVPRVESALDLRPGERLLDIGCGTGTFAPSAAGFYLGIDPALDALRFARARFGDGRRSFAAMRAGALALRPGSFDKALMANVAHHLGEAELDELLCAVREVVRGPLVLLDAALDIANPIERALLRHDRGEHVRTVAALRPLLARRYVIEREETFHNTLRVVPQVLFRLVAGRH